MRESRLSSGRSVSLYLSGVPSVAFAHAVMFKQSASGVGPSFWFAGGGTAYMPTGDWTALSTTCGADARVLVLVSDQVSSELELPLPFASSAAFVLRKYSVPPAAAE